METKVILSTAWAERLRFTDKDLADLFDIDLGSARKCSDKYTCPVCDNAPDDCDYRFFVYDPVTSPNAASGLEYVGCVCGTAYRLGFKSLREYFPGADEEGWRPLDPPNTE